MNKFLVGFVSLIGFVTLTGCAADEAPQADCNCGGAAGASGTAGTSGSGGSNATGGSSAQAGSGTSATGGSGGSSGSAGMAGTSNSGTGGASSGNTGEGGSAGASGTGATGGNAGSNTTGGSAGASDCDPLLGTACSGNSICGGDVVCCNGVFAKKDACTNATGGSGGSSGSAGMAGTSNSGTGGTSTAGNTGEGGSAGTGTSGQQALVSLDMQLGAPNGAPATHLFTEFGGLPFDEASWPNGATTPAPGMSESVSLWLTQFTNWPQADSTSCDCYEQNGQGCTQLHCEWSLGVNESYAFTPHVEQPTGPNGGTVESWPCSLDGNYLPGTKLTFRVNGNLRTVRYLAQHGDNSAGTYCVLDLAESDAQ